MTGTEAIETINHMLQLDGAVTVRGDELKCVLADEDGYFRKAYLDAGACRSLSAAFAALAESLQACKSSEGK